MKKIRTKFEIYFDVSYAKHRNKPKYKKSTKQTMAGSTYDVRNCRP